MTPDQERALKLACAIEAGLSVVTPSLRRAIAAEILRAEARGIREGARVAFHEVLADGREAQAAELEQTK